MNLSVLIPWRTDNGPRQQAFDYVRPLWEATGAEICVGEDDPVGPFNCSRALNRAFRQATNDRMVQFGADNLPDPVAIEVAYEALGVNPWLPLMSSTAYYSENSTERIFSGADPFSETLEYTLPFCTGALGYTRDAYVAAGGSDERFSGWGMEDAALRQTLAGLFGSSPALPYTLRCLWHKSDHRFTSGDNQQLMDQYTPLKDPYTTRTYLEARGTFI